MVVFCFPQHKQFNIDKDDVDDFIKFILGRNIAGRSPAPPLHVLMRAERMAWREVVYKMHQGKEMKEALKDIQADSLSCQRKVYKKIGNNTNNYAYNRFARRNYNQNKGSGRNDKGFGKYNIGKG